MNLPPLPPRVRRSAGLLLLALLTLLAACATTADARKTTHATKQPAEKAAPSVIHVVEKGQTLYRIALVYGVELKTLQRANRIRNPRQLKIGQKLSIPGAKLALEVPPFPEPIPVAARIQVAAASPRIEEIRPPVIEPGTGEWAWPIDGRYTSGFGAKRRRHIHAGIDVVAPQGTPIYPAREGFVSFVGRQSGYGQLVIIDHGDGWTSRYAHASKILVRAGDTVAPGEKIALAGRTGRATTSHLHFEIRRNGKAVDPMRYLPPPGGPLPSPDAPPLEGDDAAGLEEHGECLLDDTSEDPGNRGQLP
ncbi:MAG: LysM peptidoglycan-binding domain-containing M23 family metallopeptidase [Acidobacteria bacterium]|jgi:murein DD-endopeptidase MepM/ murein hydrolase activator NlpD|nr:LysM peptidoglycan-binding domain-containing M23 family metallopeptidase [Acidobacteriota bacterium]